MVSSKKRLNSKFSVKGISPIIAISLLLIVSITSVVMFGKWFQNYQSKIFNDVYYKDNNFVNIELLSGREVYVKNNGLKNISFYKVRVGSRICNLSGTIPAKNLSVINLGVCADGLPKGPKEVVLYTKDGVFSQVKMLRDDLGYIGDVVFKYGLCDPGYIDLYHLEKLSNSHVELKSGSNYSFHVCLKNAGGDLGNSCSGTYTQLFYIDGETDAHAYTNNTSPYVSNWYQVCVSRSSGTISSKVSSSDPNDGSFCVGSMEYIDNTNGVHMGDCNTYATKIWLKISK